MNAALDSTPRSFVLGARNPEFDFQLPSSFSGCNLDAGGIYCIDFRTGERRVSLYKDNVDALKIFEEMSLGTIVWPCSTDDTPYGLSTVLGSIETPRPR